MQRDRPARLALFVAAGILLYGATRELYEIAWGTGKWAGEFSLKWGATFAAVCVLQISLLAVVSAALWRRAPRPRSRRFPNLARWARWVIAALALLTPIGLLQDTPWGVVIDGPFLRLEIWAIAIVLAIMALDVRMASTPLMPAILGTLIVAGTLVVLGAALTEVTDYPFSLGWSEGNRLWDYSLLFGKDLYVFDPRHTPVAYLDIGRQFIGGLPFLLPRVSIFGERLWLGLISVLPSLALGILVFLPRRGETAPGWFAAGLAGGAFLLQGPIHAPLLVSAILVVGASRMRLTWAVPVLILSAFFAALSRFTWILAPAMWAVMLELGGGDFSSKALTRHAWRRAIFLAGAGILGSMIAYSNVISLTSSSTGSSATISTSQALLWYRLLPNATYGEGILLGLLRAAAPLLVGVAMAMHRFWRTTQFQKVILAAAAMASLLVGLIVSTKIGGGGDLHNLDMFLIGLLLIAEMAWRASGTRIRRAIEQASLRQSLLLVGALAIPYYSPLLSLRPLAFQSHTSWLRVLADVERDRDLGSLPDDATTLESLERIRAAVAEAELTGDVLFMDQRQLLTFGFLQGVRLIPEYEKKRMMDEAMRGNSTYFASFYDALASSRFRLIVSSPLRTPIRDSEYGFGEENNAWVDWVARPILCYYEELDTLNEVKAELLVPKSGPVECAAELPTPIE